MNIEAIYQYYHNYLATLEKLDNFKSNWAYQGILEHVSQEQGQSYLSLCLLSGLSNDEIIKFCELNDRIGNPVKSSYQLITTSPTNFRYLLHAVLILKHIQKLQLDDLNLVEIGGGYGGLCLALNHLAHKFNLRIKSYTIIDLPAVINLQARYLKEHILSFPVNLLSAFNYGNEITNNNNFLISNYCFSEISREHQHNYITKLFPKISHGFMTWNHIELYNFGFPATSETEYPLTSPSNKYVYF